MTTACNSKKLHFKPLITELMFLSWSPYQHDSTQKSIFDIKEVSRRSLNNAIQSLFWCQKVQRCGLFCFS